MVGFCPSGRLRGIVSGLLGVGSGTVVIPALVLLWGFGQKSAQGMALAAMVPMALIGALRYWRNPQVELHGVVLVLMVLGAVAGTLVGTELVGRLPAGHPAKVLRRVPGDGGGKNVHGLAALGENGPASRSGRI